MDIFKSVGRLIRYTVRAYEWALGRRHYPWSSSPPQRLFALLANRTYGWSGAHYRAVYALAGGLLKYRERIHADRVNFAARLSAPVNGEVLRNIALWQREILALPPLPPKFHVNLRIYDRDRVQLDRAMSVLLMSDSVRSISLYFDDDSIRPARLTAFTLAEEKRGWQTDAFDLNSRHALEVGEFQDREWAAIFSNGTGFDRSVNNYLKIAHPLRFVIALGLAENSDGFCDQSLPAWLEALQAFQSPIDNISFVVLNAVGPHALHADSAAFHLPLAFARSAGLSLAETICLAQKVDAFVGNMDVFGLAARTASRPGVYLGAPAKHSDVQSGIACTDELAPAGALERLRQLLVKLHTHSPKMAGMPLTGTGGTAAQAMRQRAKRQPIGAKYTLLIPTYNRPELLQRLLRYLERERAQFPIVVLDSSNPDTQARNKEAIDAVSLDVHHAVFAETMDPYVKMREGFKLTNTPYCSLCADDDILMVSAIQRCVEQLENDPKAAVAHGQYFNFREDRSFNLSYVVYRGKSVDRTRPLERLRMLFASYEAVLYGVTRTEIALRAFRDVDKMNTVLGKELLTAALTIIAGKALRISDFFYGRSTGESLAYTAWHPHQILAEEPGFMFEQYPQFRELLLQRLQEIEPHGLAAATVAKVIDLMLLRYLEPFLRHDVLDTMLDLSMRGQDSAAIVTKIWDTYVRTARPSHPDEPLLDSSGGYSPGRLGSGRPKDYVWTGQSWDGNERKYLVFYEFLFPDMQPTVLADKEKLVSLLHSLNGY